MEIRDTYDGISKYVIQFTGKPNETGRSLIMNHKIDGEKNKVTQNFKSLVINIMTEHDH